VAVGGIGVSDCLWLLRWRGVLELVWASANELHNVPMQPKLKAVSCGRFSFAADLLLLRAETMAHLPANAASAGWLPKAEVLYLRVVGV